MLRAIARHPDGCWMIVCHTRRYFLYVPFGERTINDVKPGEFMRPLLSDYSNWGEILVEALDKMWYWWYAGYQDGDIVEVYDYPYERLDYQLNDYSELV